MNNSNLFTILILIIGFLNIIALFSVIYRDPVKRIDCKDVNSKLLYKIYKAVMIGAISICVIMIIVSKILLINV